MTGDLLEGKTRAFFLCKSCVNRPPICLIEYIIMQFKNRYFVIEVLKTGCKDYFGNDPIFIIEYNLLKAIKYNILLNFGECGLALSLGSLQGMFYFFFPPKSRFDIWYFLFKLDIYFFPHQFLNTHFYTIVVCPHFIKLYY